MKRLNLGCGWFKKPGYVNVDMNPLCNPDVVHDLNTFPYPFPDNEFDVVSADHIIEHLENPFSVMEELHRILKDNGLLTVLVPHFSRGFTYADHRRGFDITFPYCFNPKFVPWYTGVEFQLGHMRFTWFAQPYLKKKVLSAPAFYTGLVMGKAFDFFANISPTLCSRLWCFWVGGFDEVGFRFVCKKHK